MKTTMNRYEMLSPQNPEDFGGIQETIAEKIARQIQGVNYLETIVPNLSFYRFERPTAPEHYIHSPGICMSLQGTKQVVLGDEVYVYKAYNFLITSIDLPVVAQILEATPDAPYLGLFLKIDLKNVSRLMVEGSLSLPKLRKASCGAAVRGISKRLLSALHRLVDLLDTPDDIQILSPMVQREILYHLLLGEQGHQLRQMAAAGSQSSQIGRTVQWLKANYTKPLRVDDLASIAGMSTSGFHQHFKALTAMSPLQYQKWMRLHEARRLMLTEQQDAATASFNVGYESPSQFSREYSRLFGAPPLRDIKTLT